MKKLVLLLIVSILICFPQLSQSAQTVTWKRSPIATPINGLPGGVLKQMTDVWSQRSKGQLKVEFHQWGEFGYKGPEMLKIFSAGIETIGEVTGNYHIGDSPLFAQTSMPFLLPSRKYIQSVINAERPYIEAELDRRGIKLLTSAAYPTVIFNKFAINSKEDFIKLKLRVHPAVIQALANLGATGIALPVPEVYQALATGIVTGVAYGYDSGIAMGFHEQTNFIYLSPVVSFAAEYFVVNKKAFNSLPNDVQKIMVDTAKEYEPKITVAGMSDSPAAVEKLRTRKVQVSETMDQGVIEWIRAGSKPVWQQWRAAHPETKEAFDAILKAVGVSLK